MSVASEGLRSAIDACAASGRTPLPTGDHGEPVFAEPWQAEVFVSTVALSQRGLFTWKQWVEVFSAEIAARPQTDGESAADAYFRQWLSALERLLDSLGVASREDIAQTKEHWRRSYINTPHGRPVEFSRRWRAPGPEMERALSKHSHHDHHHDDDSRDAAPQPIAISPTRGTVA